MAAINERQDDVLRRVVARCCQLKADVVRADEREQSGQRAMLNYGHTFAHALETLSGYGQLLHGEAVSIGMLCASRLFGALQLSLYTTFHPSSWPHSPRHWVAEGD